jgi:hypothetical protein
VILLTESVNRNASLIPQRSLIPHLQRRLYDMYMETLVTAEQNLMYVQDDLQDPELHDLSPSFDEHAKLVYTNSLKRPRSFRDVCPEYFDYYV